MGGRKIPKESRKISKKGKKTEPTETAAMSITCKDDGLYRDVLQRAVEAVKLEDFGLKGMPCKRGVTGAFIWEANEERALEKVNQIVKVLKKVLPEAKVTCLQRMGEIRLIGLDLGATPTVINKKRPFRA
ncbi:hypothetical protein M0804_014942 [Polistes exclamans]|nr:hypothetical protein M0804_014942 [Polistes exclamans]